MLAHTRRSTVIAQPYREVHFGPPIGVLESMCAILNRFCGTTEVTNDWEKITQMHEIEIDKVEQDGKDGVLATLSDGTTAEYTLEELLQIRPLREKIRGATYTNSNSRRQFS